jgi:ABC-type lipoprotein release transport system permease subunit
MGFFRAFLERAAALPGVIAVGANRYLPLRDRQYSNPIFVEGRPVEPGREPIVQFAGLAVAMAIIGIYGVTAYAAEQQKRDLAIRVALGASRTDVIRQVVRGGSMALVAGAAVGLPVAASLSRSLSAVLFEVDPLDPLVLASSTAGLVVTGVVACYLPARRAAHANAAAVLKT